MTSKRFLHKRTRTRFTAEKSAQMNKARWDADRIRRDVEMPRREIELAEIEVQNLPRREGDALGCLQWTSFRTGKVHRWVIRIGDRADRITLSSPRGEPTKSHGWSWALTKLRKHLCSQ
jgi:hypothetical protein